MNGSHIIQARNCLMIVAPAIRPVIRLTGIRMGLRALSGLGLFQASNVKNVMAQEAVTYMHACLFMLGAAYALKHGAHVRVDIFYRGFSPRAPAFRQPFQQDATGSQGIRNKPRDPSS